jgi:hypothetical protein
MKTGSIFLLLKEVLGRYDVAGLLGSAALALIKALRKGRKMVMAFVYGASMGGFLMGLGVVDNSMVVQWS